jgi:hypothetical protein
MALPKAIAWQKAVDRAIPDLTVGVFVRAPGLANLLVATLVFVEFNALAFWVLPSWTVRGARWVSIRAGCGQADRAVCRRIGLSAGGSG